MSPAIFGVIGVVLGVICTGVVNYVLEWRQHKIEYRAANRLVCSDLKRFLAFVEPVRRSGAWGNERRPLSTEVCRQYAEVMAKALSRARWVKFEGAILGIEHLELIRKQCESDKRSLSEVELAHVERIGDFVEDTVEALDGV